MTAAPVLPLLGRDALSLAVAETAAETADVLALAGRPFRLYSAAELDLLPPAEWIVDNTIPKNGLVAVIGKKGCLKTFTVLDLACHVATGLAWHGRKILPAPVVYIYSEGPFGARSRTDAWCEFQRDRTGQPFNRAELPIWFLPSRIPINDPAAVAALVMEIERLEDRPALVVVDTLNQCLDGDEDAKGMMGFVSGCAKLRESLGVTVIAVHHTPLGAEDRGRGHSAFDGAVDTRILLTRDADRLTAECTHQRNGVDGWSVAYETVPVAGSLALKPSGPTGGVLGGQRRQLLELVHQRGTLTYSAWKTESELSASSFKKARSWLLDRAYVRLDGKVYVATETGVHALGHQGTPVGHHG